ncbi:DUF262 domain-containing protein [Massilia sp. P8910]|uniref:DUF262 domain-containing protein n=1 Tax=Massilia antarctica TaxID=2765360 RepID=UPI001E51EB7A|nr:DUF262 domain-containing protein [Massilia antarctica]MCE3606444.1 DUF262 domain-containing protein [Massilia antarctica]
MSDFRLGAVASSSVLHVYSMRASIWFEPPYQRFSDVWPPSKRQLLIDSILNGYDIPKLYFHEFYPAKIVEGRKYKYAIVDGKQRLESIFSFIEGKFALDSDLEFIADPNVKAGGLTYAELARTYPDLKTKFDGFVLPIVSILTDDTELIEDMFSRLNEAVPLNAAEKRNAFGGPIPAIVRTLSNHPFFVDKVPFNNRRYRHFDLATKFLYISDRKILPDVKKIHLDEFVRQYRKNSTAADASIVESNSRTVLDRMAAIFIDDDPLLRSSGTTVLYYFLFLEGLHAGWADNITRYELNEFNETRMANRALAEKDGAEVNFNLLEFDRLTQSPNDAVALRYRYSVLRQFVGPSEGRPPLPADE